jgi:hypothetical protein
VGRVFVVKAFGRWAKSERIADTELLAAIDQADRGNVDARLGGNVLKLRIAREGGGSSGGYRTVVAFVAGEKSFFIHGWAKNEYGNVSAPFLADLKKIAKVLLEMKESDLAPAIEQGKVREIIRQEDHE